MSDSGSSEDDSHRPFHVLVGGTPHDIFRQEEFELENWLDIADLPEDAYASIVKDFKKYLKSEKFLKLPAEEMAEKLASINVVVSSGEIFSKFAAGKGQTSEQLMKTAFERYVNEERPIELRDVLISSGPYYIHSFTVTTESVDTIELYKFEDERFPATNREKGHTNYGAAVYKNKLLLVGGELCETPLKTIRSFDFVEKTMQDLPSSMKTHRSKPGVAILGEYLYAVGGSDGSESLNSVERYDLASSKWSDCAAMSTKRSGVGVAVLYNKLYAVGGYDGSNYLKTVECYHPDKQKWVKCAKMKEAKSEMGICVKNGHLYVFGGWNGRYLNSVERYDYWQNKWIIYKAKLNIAGSNIGAGVLDNKLVTIGGCQEDDKPSKSIEFHTVKGKSINTKKEDIDKITHGPCVVVKCIILPS